jgi:hypothetical protein
MSRRTDCSESAECECIQDRVGGWARRLEATAGRLRSGAEGGPSRDDLLGLLSPCGELHRLCAKHGAPWPFSGSEGPLAAFDGGPIGALIDGLIEHDPAVAGGRGDGDRSRLRGELEALGGRERWLARAIFRAADTRRGALLRALLLLPEAEGCLERARPSAQVAVARAALGLAHVWGHLGPADPLAAPIRGVLAAMETSPLLGEALARFRREHPHACWEGAPAAPAPAAPAPAAPAPAAPAPAAPAPDV